MSALASGFSVEPRRNEWLFWLGSGGFGTQNSTDRNGLCWVDLNERFISIIIRYYQILSDIIRYYQILSDIIRYHQILSDIIRYYQILSDIIRYYQILSDIIIYYQILSLAVITHRKCVSKCWWNQPSWKVSVDPWHPIAYHKNWCLRMSQTWTMRILCSYIRWCTKVI